FEYSVWFLIIYFPLLFEHFIVPNYHDFDTQPLELMWFIKKIIEASIPGFLFFVSVNYLLLHAWMNAWAEMLRFADRLFYKDWWNFTSYRAYYRTWNVVVHDWLYTYVYKDMYEILVPRNRSLAAFTVFFVSAVFHEYIFVFMFNFFYPVMLFLFGVNIIFVLCDVNVSNIFIWLSFCIGNGILVSMYAIEYYARYYCAPYSNYYINLFQPRSWNCQRQLA
ncbi:sterol O-acyltransferase 2-like, partial [Anoplolepis gracilipes]|uniref:sterol O-acyltransferase 2-like n=1 Tax=Anoplolepis gracilipes TaxID=354296 RepID=UPI003B9F5DCD